MKKVVYLEGPLRLVFGQYPMVRGVPAKLPDDVADQLLRKGAVKEVVEDDKETKKSVRRYKK